MCPAKALSLPVAVCVQEEEKKKTFSENRTVSGRSVFGKMVSSSCVEVLQSCASCTGGETKDVTYLS